jgi:AraC-like DNA-binding protein
MGGMNNIETVSATIRHIEAHLTMTRLDLDTVASAVGYSKYYLHRIFHAAVGLSIHDYVQRRRLNEAARQLVFSDEPIIDIALLAGYGSQQAFTGAFASMYKQPPRQFRRRGVFYPLQLSYNSRMHTDVLEENWSASMTDIRPAYESDIPAWMDLARLAIDGFPGLDEGEHVAALRRHIARKSAILMTQCGVPVGTLMVDRQNAHIGFLAVHPFYRTQVGEREFLRRALPELLNTRAVTTTTFRAGDKADTGHRAALVKLGFVEAEPLIEFGYPTQRMVLPKASLA